MVDKAEIERLARHAFVVDKARNPSVRPRRWEDEAENWCAIISAVLTEAQRGAPRAGSV